MTVHLSEHLTYKKIFRVVMPSILMMLFTSIYGIVDGFFISNFAGKTAFAAINLFMPICMIIGGLGFMMGAGGVALVTKTLGEGKKEKANQIFSAVFYFTIIMALIISAIFVIFMKPICVLLKATDEMMPYCVKYGTIMVGGEVFFMIQNMFQTFFMAAEKPMHGFVVTLIAGCMNMFLDFLLVGVLKFGVVGAASATILSEMVGSIIPFVFFIRPNSSALRLIKPVFVFSEILKCITNGCSELLSSVAGSIVGIVYNYQLLHYIGENGVAAYGVLMYASFIFIAIFIGYATGIAGFVGYNFGSKNSEELKNIKKKSFIISLVTGSILFVLSFSLARILAMIFVSYDEELLDLTTKAMRYASFSYIITGWNIFVSSFFTALNNGLISGLISTLRTLVFQIAAVLSLPAIFGIDGIWCAVLVSEVCTTIVSICVLLKYKKRYQY